MERSAIRGHVRPKRFPHFAPLRAGYGIATSFAMKKNTFRSAARTRAAALLSFPSPALRERVDDPNAVRIGRERALLRMRSKKSPLPPSLRSGTLSRKRERGSERAEGK